ncbi:TIGR03086 family metal-binding protein [Actinomycetospora sp. TBRC 11914]|uniref:TIGR03086 family metal-binding protein n=1 Tax=Actinomycetospora sp. TBRC 11914 TaxID=2729387 RepID=UPI0028A239C4|nr:TIGR03086 family metal-binding protein [Actinomycetospora sp. TBRC 11914]
MPDLTPACEATAALVAALHDDELALPTPCDALDVAGVVAHLDLAGQGFAVIGRHGDDEPAPPYGPDRGPTWRRDLADVLARLADVLARLADAWRDPAAWEGDTDTGVALPNATWGRAALTEVVVHGWDLARATGRPLRFPEVTLRATLDHVLVFVPAAPVPALWGTPATVPDDAPLLDRVVAATGRRP